MEICPLSATLATQRIYEGFAGDTTRAFLHGHTFCGNPLAAAVGREVLAIYREESVLQSAAPKAAKLGAAFEQLGSREGVHRSRALGMIGACDLGDGGYHARVGWAVHHARSGARRCAPTAGRCDLRGSTADDS